MLINTRVEYVWSDKQSRYILSKKLSINWTGPVCLLKGASSTQEDLNKSQVNFYNTLSSDYSSQFANQNAVLNSLKTSLDPILKAGPNQYGFSNDQTNALNTTAIEGTGRQYANASKALKETQAAQGGGDTLLPSGVSAQQNAALASSSAHQASDELLGIKNAGYAQGYNMYQTALGSLSNVAGMYNPTGYAGQATGAGNAAADEANKITEENNAASPWNTIGGILGGAISTGLGAYTGGIGKAAACPAKGSLFLMADGSEKKVEDLKVGEYIAGIDGEAQEIEEIQIAPLPVVNVKTENGFRTRNSTIHAFALPVGGFVIAAKSLGKNIVTASGPSKVIHVEKDGVDTIYNVITEGSHTYRADGVWALGQGEGEREVSTEAWQRVSNRVEVEEYVSS